VNLYSIRRSTFADRLLPRLESLVRMGCTDEYYERAIAGAIADRDAHFHTVPFSDLPWLEIDTLRDLARAESMLAPAARLRRVRCSG
jgi:choline kinase